MYIIMTTPKLNPSKHLPASGTNRHCHPGISTPQVREERTLTWAQTHWIGGKSGNAGISWGKPMVIHRFPVLPSTNPATKSSDSAPQIAQAPSPFCKFITQPVAFFGAKRPLDDSGSAVHGKKHMEI